MNVTLVNGKPGVWTVRQLWDKEKTSYHLQLTLHDGTQDKLSFIRKISTDDLNKIANAESRATSGSISETVKTAEAITPTNPPIQVEPEIPPPPPKDTVSTVETQLKSTNDTSSEVNWMPSFDCAKASIGSERLICSNKELSDADVKLAQVYKSAINKSMNKTLLKSSQKAWRINERDACSMHA